FHRPTTRAGSRPRGRHRSTRPQALRVSTADPGSSAKNAGVASGPPRCELRPVEERRHDPRRADRADEVGDFVVLSKVLADQHYHGEPLAELDEVQNASGYVHGFPPPHRGVQLSPQVILIDL